MRKRRLSFQEHKSVSITPPRQVALEEVTPEEWLPGLLSLISRMSSSRYGM